MTKRKPDDDLIEQLLAAANEAKATIRELHEARRDARTIMAELDAKVDTIRDEVIDANNELAIREWKRAMESINLDALSSGLKDTFGKWLAHLKEAEETLKLLKAHEDRLRVASAAIRRVENFLP